MCVVPQRSAEQIDWYTKSEIKVFQLNDCDWWAGRSLEEIKPVYMEITGIDEAEAFDEPFELDAQDMQKFMYTDEDHKDRKTFAEVLDQMITCGTKFPCFFASTEY